MLITFDKITQKFDKTYIFDSFRQDLSSDV